MTPLTVGSIYKLPTQGLLRFLGYDTYFGETTAKFERINSYHGYYYARLDALNGLELFA